MKHFTDTKSYAFRKVIYDAIKRADLHHAERLVVRAVVDQWMYSKNSHSETMDKTRSDIARRSKTSPATVARVMKKLRDCGSLVTVERGSGGSHYGTVYRMRLVPLMMFLGAKFPGQEWLSCYGYDTADPYHHDTAENAPHIDIYYNSYTSGPVRSLSQEGIQQ